VIFDVLGGKGIREDKGFGIGKGNRKLPHRTDMDGWIWMDG